MNQPSSELHFSELLEGQGIDPATVVVFRHRPSEAELNRNFDWIVAERPDLFNCYQATHAPRTEAALKRASFVASFIRRRPGEALYVGTYKVEGWQERSSQELAERPLQLELERFGMVSASTSIAEQRVAEFNLQKTEFLASWRRRLVVGWPGLERSWYRWADRNIFPVIAVTLEDDLCPAVPNWTEIRLTKLQLAILPENWRAAMRQWRGIYLITDESDRRYYVGSAGGEENMLQRWMAYSHTGHGGNKRLRGRNPDNFVFSILELVSPTTLQSSLILLESSWKRRLGTYWPQGLNES